MIGAPMPAVCVHWTGAVEAAQVERARPGGFLIRIPGSKVEILGEGYPFVPMDLRYAVAATEQRARALLVGLLEREIGNLGRARNAFAMRGQKDLEGDMVRMIDRMRLAIHALSPKADERMV